MELTNESKTLFIPLLGKATMSKNNLFLKDLKAEEIISKIDNDLSALKQTKWLSMYMSLRALIIDDLCNKYITTHKNVTVIHLGCGLDSRCLRVKQKFNNWYDLDFANVIKLRKNYFEETTKYKMIGSSVLDYSWLNQIDATDNILIVAEGLTMYLAENDIKELINQIASKFKNIHLIFDAYTKLGVKLSKIKNPVNQMAAKIKYGINTYKDFLKLNKNLVHINTRLIRKEDNDLKYLTKFIFNNLYCGRLSKSLYKIYEFSLKNK